MSMSLCPCLHVSLSPCFHVSMSIRPLVHVSLSLCFHVSMVPCPCLNVSGILQTENGTNGKQQLPFVFCKRKAGISNFSLFAAIRNRKLIFVFLGRQAINGNRRLLLQQTCPSMGDGSIDLCVDRSTKLF
jgi:hypothetical protein